MTPARSARGTLAPAARALRWLLPGNLLSLAAAFAEPHVVPSPTGTRAFFGSDWGGASTDAFVLELPAGTR